MALTFLINSSYTVFLTISLSTTSLTFLNLKEEVSTYQHLPYF